MRHAGRTSKAVRLMAAAAAIAAGVVLAVGGRAVAQQNQDFSAVEMDIVPVRGGVYMIVGAGGNTTIQVGEQGIMVVDTQFAPLTEKLLAAIRSISDAPIRYVINTHVHPDHIGGNEGMAKAGSTRAGGNVVGDIGAAATNTAAVIAHENVLKRLSEPAPGTEEVPFALWPTETYISRTRDLLFNDEAVRIIHEPAAHTDGDSLVFFRRSDVIATGDLFTTVMYPVIDVANGGTIDGYIDALNAIIDLTVPSNVNEGGTMVVPGHGRLSDEQDVVEYRNMATIVRDRIKEYVRRGMTLEQVKAAKPTLDYDGRYGSDTGVWTTAQFIEVIYNQMAAAKAPSASSRTGNPNQRRGNE